MTQHALENAPKADLLAIIERQARTIAEQAAQIRTLQTRVEALEAEVARLQKTSATSSKPPSSDIVKPPKPSPPEGQPTRKQGAQPGHPQHARTPFPPEALSATYCYTQPECPRCGHPGDAHPKRAQVVQQAELVEQPLRVSEHRAMAYFCRPCGRWYYAPLPPAVVQGGLLGPRLTALAAYLKGSCHASVTTVQSYLREVLGLAVSRGLVAKALQKTSRALEVPYTQLRAALPEEPYLNVDETGHKDKGRRHWIWCFRAGRFTVFAIAPSRGSQVLHAVLGEGFGGVVGCDYFSAYRKYHKDTGARLQLCLGHPIRDFRFLTTLPGQAQGPTRAYAQGLLEHVGRVFHHWHRRTEVPPEAARQALEQARDAFLEHAIRGAPETRQAKALAQRFREHGAAHFRFLEEPGVEPTNNRAEQAIRFVVIDRHVTQGTRSDGGQRWCERIWSVRATCAAQERSVYAYLCEAVQAHLTGQPAPSLLPDTS